MASFPICPLIDQKIFLGVSDDCTPGCIIVSLGKNIIIRFRLSDQKQLSSWTTKDKLSTPVFYDSDREEYFAIFNGELISRWSKDKRVLKRKFGKYKLPWIIHSIYCISGIRPIMLSKSGHLALYDTDKKHSISILKNDVLPDGQTLDIKAFSFHGINYLCFLVKESETTTVLKFTQISETDENSFSVNVNRRDSDSTLSCYTVMEEKGKLMSLWSDGYLYSFDLEAANRNLKEFPGKHVSTLNNVNCALPCVMLALDNHVAVYGADANGEGAKIVWVEGSFGVIQNSLHLKLYSNPPRMWKVGSSYLIAPVGQNLTVIPFQLKNVPKLDSLLAAHCASDSSMVQVSWEKVDNSAVGLDSQDETMSDILRKVKGGCPEHKIGEEVVISLLEEGKIEEALNDLNKLTDIPDKCAIDSVIGCLNSKSKKSEDLLFQALSFPLLNDNETVSYIRNKLSFESAISLLGAIHKRMKVEPDNECLLKWITLLLDSHYQQYLLSKDEAVVNQLLALNELVNDLIADMNEYKEFYKLLTGSLKTKVSSKSSVQYSVDKFRLF